MVRLSLPASVPPDCVMLAVEMAPPVVKFNAPPVIVKGPTLVTVPGVVKVAMPPDAVVPPVMLYVPVSVSVPPEKFTVPAPLNAPLSANVTPALDANLKVAPDPTLHVPPQVPPQLPPPPKLSVPLLACTDPVLLKATGLFTLLVPVPPVFSNTPPLMITWPTPPPLTIKLSF